MQKWPLVREGIGWFVAGIVADGGILILQTTVFTVIEWRWGARILTSPILLLITPLLLIAYGIRKEVKRQASLPEALRHGKPKRRHHPFFGEIVPDGWDNADGQWLAEIPLPPFTDDLALFIQADFNGPTEKDVEFTKWVQLNFQTIVARLEPKLRSEFNLTHEKPAAESFLDEFTLASLVIPKDGDPQNEWEIAFTSKQDREHVFGVAFEGGKPSYVTMDG